MYLEVDTDLHPIGNPDQRDAVRHAVLPAVKNHLAPNASLVRVVGQIVERQTLLVSETPYSEVPIHPVRIGPVLTIFFDRNLISGSP